MFNQKNQIYITDRYFRTKRTKPVAKPKPNSKQLKIQKTFVFKIKQQKHNKTLKTTKTPNNAD